MVRLARSLVSWRGPLAAFRENFADAVRPVAPIQVAAALRHLVQQRGLPVLVIHVWAGGPHRAVCSAPTAAPSSG